MDATPNNIDVHEATGHISLAVSRMKNTPKTRKPGANGKAPTRSEMLAAHERWLKRVRKMTARESFASLVRAGIVTPEGKLAARYGG